MYYVQHQPLTKIWLTASFADLVIPGFGVSVLPAPPEGVAEGEATASAAG